MSKFDYVYRRFVLSKFFTNGWGDPNNLRRLLKFRRIISRRETCCNLVSPDYPITIDKEEDQRECTLIHGHFLSPFEIHLPGIMPEETKIARFQMLIPNEDSKLSHTSRWTKTLKPICIHLAGTGDHGFYRRKVLMARPLLKQAGIGSIILENPYYGVRKPKEQSRSALRNVSDLFVMGGALVLECLALLHWCEGRGFGPLGLTGISMGGHMASLAATNWHKPLPLIPCLSWSTASPVFTQGVMSNAIPWKLLQEQYLTDRVYQDELSKLIHTVQENQASEAFVLGQNFAKDFTPDKTDNAKAMPAFSLPNASTSAISTDGKKHLHTAPLHYCSNPSVTGPGVKLLTTDQGTTDSLTVNPIADNDSTLGGVGISPRLHSIGHDSQVVSSLKTPTAAKDSAPNIAGSSATGPHPASVSGVRGTGKGQLFRPNRLGASHPNGDSKTDDNFEQQVVDFMRGVMDECTHIGNFSVPVDPSMIIVVVARADGYVPRDNVLGLNELWPGVEIRYVDSGHIGAFLTKQTVFRQAIMDAFDRTIKKYYT